MDDDQQFCLRWNNHQSTLVSVFDTLLEKGIHVDCTLAAEGQTLKAHKVVLSACSPYFESVLSQQFDKHPIIILKDVKYAELRAMMDYMYRGEVNISQDQLAALLKAAESLQIKGLSDNKPSRPPSRPPPAPPATAHPPHTPRAPSPPPQARSLSPGSRSGSVSPSRRRKKPRRLSDTPSDPPAPLAPSAPIVPIAPLPTPTPIPTEPKDEPQRPVEYLTADEDADDVPNVTHNDVVRNFQWHLERSQDELSNSEGAREPQGRRASPRSIVTRSKKMTEEREEREEKATTFAILKPRKVSAPAPAPAPAPPPLLDYAKENAKAPVAKGPPPAKGAPVAKEAAPTRDIVPAKESPGAPQSPRVKTETETDAEGGEGGAGGKWGSGGEGAEGAEGEPRPPKRYKCPTCARLYNARRNLVRHVTLECGREPRYRCPLCAYSKHRRNELKKHMERKHPGDVEFFKTMMQNILPIVPMKTTNLWSQYDMSYECGTCKRKYRHKSTYRRHVTYECGKEPMFRCPFIDCSYKAYQKTHTDAHIKTKHRIALEFKR